MVLWIVHSYFHRCKNYKNGPIDARVIVENKAVPFLWNTVYIADVTEDDLRRSSMTVVHKAAGTVDLECTFDLAVHQVRHWCWLVDHSTSPDTGLPVCYHHHHHHHYLILVSPRGSAVERQSLASVLSPSCARPVADGWPLMSVSYTHLTLPTNREV